MSSSFILSAIIVYPLRTAGLCLVCCVSLWTSVSCCWVLLCLWGSSSLEPAFSADSLPVVLVCVVRYSVVRRVVCELAITAWRKHGCLNFYHGCFRLRFGIGLSFHLLWSRGVLPEHLSWCFWFHVDDLCYLRRIDGHKRFVRKAWSFAGVGDSMLLSVPGNCRFGTLASFCRFDALPVGLLVCALFVKLCSFLLRQPSVAILLLYIPVYRNKSNFRQIVWFVV